MNTETAAPLVQGVAWVGDKLIATDPDVVDRRIRRKALSASTSKSMKGCLAKYAVEKLLPRENDPFSVTELGTATHAIFEDLYQLPNAERTKDKFLSLKEAAADVQWSAEKFAASESESTQEWEASRTLWKSEIDRLGLKQFDIENPAEQTVYKTEMSFEGVTIAGGVPTMGFIDRVDIAVVRERNRFKIVDYKTGKMKSAFDLRRYGDDHGDQIRIYSDAVREITGETPAIGEIHYTQFGVAREISLSDLNMEHTRKDFRESWDIHNRVTDSGEFETKVGPLCGWCPVVNSCPAAKAAGKTASDRVAKIPPTAVALGIPTVRAGSAAAKPMGSKLPVTAPVIIVPEKKNSVGGPAAVFAAPEAIPYSDEAPADTGDWFDTNADDTALVESAALSAHVLRSNSNDNGTGTPTMNDKPLFSEGKPWEPTINGLLNGASYAAMAVISIPQIAGELLIEAGRPLNSPTLDRMTDLLAEIIITVQKGVRADTFAWDDGINTRIRGALRTTIETLPMPWDATEESAWEDWQKAATKRTSVFIMKSLRLWNLGEDIPENTFNALLPTPVADISSKPKPGVRQVA